MELFTIHCTTCKARLIVKDESVIGDILACPKCQSMVQVVPPPDWNPAAIAAAAIAAPVVPPTAAPPVESPSASRAAGTSVPPQVVKTPSGKTNPAAATKKAAAAVPPALPPRHTPAEISAPMASSVPSAMPLPSAAPVAADVEPVASPPAAESLSENIAVPAAASPLAALLTRARKDWLVLGGGLTGGVALGTIAWLVMWWQTPTAEPPATASRQVAVAPPGAQPTQPDPAATQTLAELPADPTVRPEPGAVIGSEPPATIASEPPAPAENTPEPAIAEAAPAPAPDAAPSQAAATEPSAAVASAEPPKPALKLDPIAQSSVPANVAVPALNEFRDAPPAQEVTSGAVGLEPAADAPEPPADTDTLADSQLLPVSEIERHLAISLSRVEFNETTLGHFAAFLGDVSGVPVLLDETSLAKAGKSRKTKISFALTTTTALAVLQKGTAAADLQYAIQPGRIIISSASP